MASTDRIKFGFRISAIVMAVICCGVFHAKVADAALVAVPNAEKPVNQQRVVGQNTEQVLETGLTPEQKQKKKHHHKGHSRSGQHRNDAATKALLAQLIQKGQTIPSPYTQLATNAGSSAIAHKRSKRNGCGCCCCCSGSGSGERKRKRARARAARGRLYSVLRRFLTPFNFTVDTAQPGHARTANTTFPRAYDEVESREVLVLLPNSASNETILASYETSAENMVMPYVGGYGKQTPPGGQCQRDQDCVIGAKCAKVGGIGHCVCKPPLVNLGNSCVPRSGVPL